MGSLEGLSLGFFGTPDFSLQFLKFLHQKKLKISYVVSQPPANSGRGKKLLLSPVHEWSKKKKIPIFTPTKTGEKDFLNEIKKFNVDFIIVVAYGNIIEESILNLPKYLAINVHASLLPRWRGAAPIQRAILAGDKLTGVSVMKVVKELDAGPVILDKKLKIFGKDTSGTIYEKIINLGKALLSKSMKKIVTNDFKFKSQDIQGISYAKKIEKDETKIVWNNDAEKINLKIRAFNPFPGAWTLIDGTNIRIKILKAVVLDSCAELEKNNFVVGKVSKSLTVKCGEKYLKIIELQKQGKKKMTVNEFLNGNKIRNLIFK